MDILIAGRKEGLGRRLADRLADAGYRVETTSDAGELAGHAANGLRLVILTSEFVGGDILSVLSALRARRPELPVVVLAGEAPGSVALGALERGAAECVTGEVDVEAVVSRVARLLGGGAGEFVTIETHGHRALWSRETRGLYESLVRAARGKGPVLITGETGTGKGVAARTMWALSARKSRSTVVVNCAALSAGLLESELFGHVKGAYTGASRDRKGRFEEADGGMIVLDEVGELGPDLQPKLLRVLEEGEFERVGSNETRRADVFVVAITNRDLEADVEAGRFRKDLFFRLNVVRIHVPPLRARRGEIPLFVKAFFDAKGKRVSNEAMELLCRYDWPGNVREVEDLAERLGLLVAEERIEPRHLPEEMLRAGNGEAEPEGRRFATLEEARNDAERRHILEALRRCEGSLRGAARLLGVARGTLKARLRKYGLPAGEPDAPKAKA